MNTAVKFLFFMSCAALCIMPTSCTERGQRQQRIKCDAPYSVFWKQNNALRHAGFGWCHRCKRTWDVVEGHSTDYAFMSTGAKFSCFPLCESCWKLLGTPEARIPFYRALYDDWKREGIKDEVHKWEPIEASVMKGN